MVPEIAEWEDFKKKNPEDAIKVEKLMGEFEYENPKNTTDDIAKILRGRLGFPRDLQKRFVWVQVFLHRIGRTAL